MSALSVASDVKEEEGGGCYENCSMLKQSDGDIVHARQSRRASLFRSLLQTLTLIRCCTQGHRGIEPERALRTRRSAGERHCTTREMCPHFFKKSGRRVYSELRQTRCYTHTCSALRQDCTEHVLGQIFAV